MLSAETRQATSALVDRDPALAGLEVLLDDVALSRWLSEQLGRRTTARRRYLRYKPGTSCVAAVSWETGEGPRTVVVSAYSPEAAVKAHKSSTRAPSGSVVATDPSRRLLGVTPAADRDLPALARLADPAARERLLRHPGGRLTELAYKPHRRWVGRVDSLEGAYLLRVYRPADLAPALRAITALNRHDVPTSSLVRTRPRHGVAALRYVSGTTLTPQASREQLRAAGRALAAVHGCVVDIAAAEAAGSGALAAAAAQVAIVLPALTERAADLADRLRGELDRRGHGSPPVTLHGDFSLDQVVVSPAGATLLDLDRAGLGPAESDLGSVVASVVADPSHHHRADTVLAGLLAGYAAEGARLDDDAVRTYAAAHLLRRAGEPFRRGDPAWAEEARRILGAAEKALAVGSRS